ncbi:14243_t:CDS:1, partial [Ambispora leptoticha]
MKFLVNFLTSLSLGDWITILFVTIILYISLFYYEYYTRDNPLPGPFPLPIVGSLYQKSSSNLAKWIYDLAKIHGEIFEIWIGPQRQIVLSSAELIEQLNVPSTKSNFIIRYAYHEGLEAWGTDTGITFNRNIESWRFNRKYFDYAVTNPS